MVGNKFTTELNGMRYVIVGVGNGNGIHTKEMKNNNAAQVIKKTKQQILDAWRMLKISQDVRLNV